MTLEEAKKLLKKEGFGFHKTSRPLTIFSKTFDRYESPKIVEALKVLVKNKYNVTMESRLFHECKERLKKEFEANTTAPRGDSSGRIGEGGIPLNATEGMHLKWADNKNTAENPALNESAKLFNDALLDEQAKKIEHLDELSASRNKIIVKQSKKISKLRKVIRDKDAVLSDVSEELRLSKVREDKLTEVCQKYLKEIEGLKNQLHDLQQKHFALMDERDQTVGELKAKIRNLKKPRIPTPEETKPYPAEDNPEDANPKYNIYVEDWVWKALGKERKKPTEDDIMEGCKEMMRMNIKLMRDLLGE